MSMHPPLEILLPDLNATRQLALKLAGGLVPLLGRVPMTVALSGTLGSGKTQWIRYLCEQLGVLPELVTSPTYVLLQRYRGQATEIYHFDYYRLQSAAQVWDLGIDELQEQPVLVLVEWADKFPETLPADHIQIRLTHTDQQHRVAHLTATGPRSREVLRHLSQPEW
jgi:tRNA threonylcarbamoyladenosine biosynthesis protein TsaE